MEQIKVSFSYKGKREYIQGPDIFDKIIETLDLKKSEITSIKYSAHSWIKNNATLFVNPEKEPKGYGSLVTYINEDAIKKSIYVVDNGDKITESEEYSEAHITKNAIIVEDVVSLKCGVDTYSFNELVVSMNKFFLQQITTEGKWIVTKIEYHNLSHVNKFIDEEIKIRLVKNMRNKLTKSEVFVSNVLVGFVYFSLV